MRETIGRGTWIDKVASEIIKREEKIGRSLGLLRVESGLGASGIPHVGSMGDAVRAYGVKMALEDMGYNSEFIAYSDDMDGLRKVPEGLPNSLNAYLAKPVSSIPDPSNCHSSYGSHMSSMLIDALDKVNIEYRHQSGTEVYRSGILNRQIALILENSLEIGKKISETLGQKKFEEVLPYYPICAKCGRIYVAEAYEFHQKERKILYRCKGALIGNKYLDGCGYEGEVDITKGEGKLSWKGEFAARWSALDIRFEAYGKDIADSVKVNDWISDRILKNPHPHHIKYELFLDKSGRKISKSVGNVFTPQTWLKYGSPQSLLLLMYKRSTGTRNLSVEDIPTYVDEYDSLEDTYFSNDHTINPEKRKSLTGLYEYINHLKPPTSPSTHVPYRLLLQLASVSPSGMIKEYVIERLLSYRIIRSSSPNLVERIKLVSNWSEDFKNTKETVIKLGKQESKAISDLVDFISAERDANSIQNKIFELSKHYGITPPIFFRALYRILLSSERGPRLGQYIVDVGSERVLKLLSTQLNSYKSDLRQHSQLPKKQSTTKSE